MSKNNEKITQFEKELREIDEKLEKISNFSTLATLSLQEHKMLVEGYKKDKFFDSEEFKELEKCDLLDYFALERNNGGTTF